MLTTLLLAAGLLQAQQADASFFNGKDLAGWTVPGESFWSVEDGAIVGRVLEHVSHN